MICDGLVCNVLVGIGEFMVSVSIYLLDVLGNGVFFVGFISCFDFVIFWDVGCDICFF